MDLVCCRHVIEHLADPGELIRLMSQTLGGQPQARVYLEVPNGAYTFEDLGIWDLIYEHCSYFSEESLRRLVSRNGLRPIASGVAFHNQFLWVECAPRANESLEVS
jgi:hypothetical protein